MRFNILCVDEFGITKVELMNVLKSLNVNIIGVKDESDALTVLDDIKMDISAIVWSVNSVDLKDFEAVKRVNSMDAYRKIPIIIVSKFTGKKFVIKAIESGAIEYIAKPYDETAVLKKICRLIGIPYEKTKDKTNDEDIITYNFPEMFSKEIKAATRGNYPMTVMLIRVVPNGSNYEPGSEADNIAVMVTRVLKTKLRETDTVFHYGSNNMILLLPFATKESFDVIKKKIDGIYGTHAVLKEKISGYGLIYNSVTFPDDGKVKEKLLEKLEQSADSSLSEE